MQFSTGRPELLCVPLNAQLPVVLVPSAAVGATPIISPIDVPRRVPSSIETTAAANAIFALGTGVYPQGASIGTPSLLCETGERREIEKLRANLDELKAKHGI
jgi:hypothetical protein